MSCDRWAESDLGLHSRWEGSAGAWRLTHTHISVWVEGRGRGGYVVLMVLWLRVWLAWVLAVQGCDQP